MAFELPPLPYAPDALEPYIDARTMTIHHGKHHAGYTNNLNNALADHPSVAAQSIKQILGNLNALPEEIRTAVRNNGGGEPGGALAAAINAAFGSFATFKEKFSTAAGTRFGSGWAWLYVAQSGALMVGSTPNQDTPLMEGNTPILGLDVWEHAYYLNYQNRRGDYVAAWWNVVNWDQVAANYGAATGG